MTWAPGFVQIRQWSRIVLCGALAETRFFASAPQSAITSRTASDTRLAHRRSRRDGGSLQAAKEMLLMVPLHAKRVARTSTSRPRAAAALTSAVRVFLDGATLRRSQHRTGSAFMRRCAGQPHAPRAVVVHRCARPRLAPAPVPAHLPAHFAAPAVCFFCTPPRSATAACV